MAATKSTCLAAARKRWGKTAVVVQHDTWETPAQRQAARDKRAEIRARINVLDQEIKALGGNYPALLKACRFVVDVDPSIPELKKALEHAEAVQARMDERSGLHNEQKGLGGYGYRWASGEDGGWVFHCHVEADTLDDLLAKIQQSGQ